MRHGQALQGANPELSTRGIKEINIMARFLFSHFSLNKIYCSPKQRAYETAQIFEKSFQTASLKSTDHCLPGASVGALAQLIENQSENLLIVSHLPMVAYLASFLLIKSEELNFSFSTGSCLILEQVETQWKILGFYSPSFLEVG